MPDREKSTPQPPESERALRETFLWRFDDPEHRETLQGLGDLLFLLANEAHVWGATKGWGLIPGRLNAAADDLEHLAGYLFEIAGEPTWSEVDRKDLALSARAETWAGPVRSIVSEIRRATGAEGGEAAPDPMVKLTDAARRVLTEARERRKLLRGTSPAVDALEDALQALTDDPGDAPDTP